MRRLAISLVLLGNLLLSSWSWAGITFDKVDDVLSCGAGSSIADLAPASLFIAYNLTDAGENGRGRFFDKSQMGMNVNLTDVIGRNAHCYGVSCATDAERVSSTTLSYNTGAEISVDWDGTTSGTTINIYLNGTEVSYASSADGVGLIDSDAASTLFIGNNTTDGTRTANGTYFEAAIWAAEIGAQTHVNLASKLKGVAQQLETSTLKAYWPFMEKAHGTSADGVTQFDPVNANNCTGNNGTDNAGMTYAADTSLNYMPAIISGQ